MKSKQDLTVGNINKKLWAFAIPLMLGNVMQQFYNLVDTWVVGKYIGDNARTLSRQNGAGGGRLFVFADDIFNIGDFGIVSWQQCLFFNNIRRKKYKTTEKRNVYFVCYDRNIFTYTDVCVILSLRPDYENTSSAV